jgi:hypothetical protein
MTAQSGQAAWPRNHVLWESQVPRVIQQSLAASGVNLSELEAYGAAVVAHAMGRHECDRRKATDRRRLIAEDAWAPLLRASIREWVRPETAKAVMGSNYAHVDTVKNPARDVWAELASLYDVEATRTTDNERDAQRYIELCGEDFDCFWEDVDFALETYNDVIIWPSVVIRNGQKQIKHRWAAGNTVSVVESEDDPTELDAICFVDAWHDMADRLVSRYRLWTDQWHAVFNEQRMRVDKGDGVNPYGSLDTFVRLRRRCNQLGFWSTTLGEDLIEATLHVGRLRTFTNYLWKMSSHKQVAIVGPDAQDVTPQQLADPGAFLRIQTDGQMVVIDWQVDFDGRLRYQDADVAAAAASRGINPESLKRTANYQTGKSARLAERPLRERRRKKAKIFRPAEKAYYRAVHRVAAAHGIRDLYDADAALDVQHGATDYPDDPMAQLEYEKEAAALGVSSALEMIRARNPTLTRKQAMARLEANLKVTGQIAEMKAKRNVPNDLSAESRTAEENGQLGPIIRDDNRDQGSPIAGG